MKETLEGHFCGADDEHYFVYPKEKTLSDLYKKKNTTAEKQKEKVEDEEGKKHSSVSTYHDMIDDVSQKLKIGFEQYIKAKEDEIRKLKNELSVVKSISDGVHKEKQMLVLNLNKAKTENKQLAQSLDKVQAGNRLLAQRLREVQKANQQLAHDLDKAKTENKELAQQQEEALDEYVILECKLEDAQAEKQKLSEKLDVARIEIDRQNIAIGHLKKKAERKDTAVRVDISEVKEEFAKEMIGSAVKFVKGLKKRINHGHEVLYTELLQQMTNGCFSEGESIRDELYKLIDEIPAYLKQIANEEPRPNNVTVEEGGVYNAVVNHQDIHPEADQPGSLPEVDQLDFLPRNKRKRLGLEGEDYEWK